MPFDRPTLEELRSQNLARIDEALDDVDARPRRSVINAIATANSGAHHMLFAMLQWIANQSFPDTVDGDELDRQIEPWGIERIPAAKATGAITVKGVDGSVVPVGTVWADGDGNRFRSTSEVRIAAGKADVPVEAQIAGSAGNIGTDAQVSLAVAVAGVERVGRSAEINGGRERENDDNLRLRWLDRRRMPPRGGTVSDYVLWARSANADVTRGWARALQRGLGTVNVYIMTDNATDNGIPVNQVVQAVQTYIDARRPVTADVDVIAPTPVALAVSIRALMPDTAAVRLAIQMEIADLIRRESEPGGTIHVSRIREAISTAQGEFDHELVSPLADVTVKAAEISVSGDVTFVS